MHCSVGPSDCLLDWWNHSYQEISPMHTRALTPRSAVRSALHHTWSEHATAGTGSCLSLFYGSEQDGCTIPASAPVRNAELIFRCWSKFQPSLSFFFTGPRYASQQPKSFCKCWGIDEHCVPRWLEIYYAAVFGHRHRKLGFVKAVFIFYSSIIAT